MGCSSTKPVAAASDTSGSVAESQPRLAAAPTSTIRDGSIIKTPKQGQSQGGFDRSKIVIDEDRPIAADYDFGQDVVGEGAFGAVFRGTHKVSGYARAIKSIPKANIAERATICNEIAVMKMCDHPDIIKTFATYEDDTNVYLVMEICSGGELFDKLMDEVFFTEGESAELMQQVMRAIQYFHQNLLIHRDIKAENFLLVNDGPVKGNKLKLIDFGCSKECKPGQHMKTKCGTAYYMAPEVLEGRYNQMADVWSCGVMMYFMLCGDVPFPGDNANQILPKVKSGKFDFDREEFENVSDDAKTMIRNMLRLDPTKRLTAEQSCNDGWIQKRAPKASDVFFDACGTRSCAVNFLGESLGNMKDFSRHNRLKKAALNVVAGQLEDSQVVKVREIFLMLDENGDGTLVIDDVRPGLERHGMDCPPGLEKALKSADLDCTGVINYTEFLAASMDYQEEMTDEACRAAFYVFDNTGQGFITEERLLEVLGQANAKDRLGQEAVQSLMMTVDTKGDGIIDFDEFCEMMRAAPLPFGASMALSSWAMGFSDLDGPTRSSGRKSTELRQLADKLKGENDDVESECRVHQGMVDDLDVPHEKISTKETKAKFELPDDPTFLGDLCMLSA